MRQGKAILRHGQPDDQQPHTRTHQKKKNAPVPERHGRRHVPARRRKLEQHQRPQLIPQLPLPTIHGIPPRRRDRPQQPGSMRDGQAVLRVRVAEPARGLDQELPPPRQVARHEQHPLLVEVALLFRFWFLCGVWFWFD